MLNSYNRQMGKDMTMGAIDTLASILGVCDGESRVMVVAPTADPNSDSTTCIRENTGCPFDLSVLPLYIRRVSARCPVLVIVVVVVVVVRTTCLIGCWLARVLTVTLHNNIALKSSCLDLHRMCPRRMRSKLVHIQYYVSFLLSLPAISVFPLHAAV